MNRGPGFLVNTIVTQGAERVPKELSEDAQRRVVKDTVLNFLAGYFRENELDALRTGSGQVPITVFPEAGVSDQGTLPFSVSGEYAGDKRRVRVNYDHQNDGFTGGTNEIHVTRKVAESEEEGAQDPMIVGIDCKEVARKCEVARLSCEVKVGANVSAQLAFPLSGGKVELACDDRYLDSLARELWSRLFLVRPITRSDLEQIRDTEKPLPDWARIVEHRIRKLLFAQDGVRIADPEVAQKAVEFQPRTSSKPINDTEQDLLVERATGCMDIHLRSVLSDSELDILKGWRHTEMNVRGEKKDGGIEISGFFEANAHLVDSSSDRYAIVETWGTLGSHTAEKELKVNRTFRGESPKGDNNISMETVESSVTGTTLKYVIDVWQGSNNLLIEVSADPAHQVKVLTNTGDCVQELSKLVGEVTANFLLYGNSSEGTIFDAVLAIVREKIFGE